MDTNHNNMIVWEEEESGFNLRELLHFFWTLKYWIAASVVVSVSIVFLFIKISNPSYEKSAIVMMVNDEGNSSNELALLYDLTGKTQTSKIDNEIFILRSSSLMEDVVRELGLNTRYFEFKVPIFNSQFTMLRPFLNIKKVEFYKNSPFLMEIKQDSLTPLQHIYMEFNVEDGNTYQISDLRINGQVQKLSKREYRFGEQLMMNGQLIHLHITDSARIKRKSEYACSWEKPYHSALALSSSLKASVLQEKGKQTDLILLIAENTNPLRAEDIINTLIIKYNQQNRTFKNEARVNTISFIDNRLQVITRELGEVESDMKRYQSSNTVVNLESQSHFTLTSDMQYEMDFNDVQLQLKVLDMINDYIKEIPQLEYKVIPANVGVKDNGLNEIINQYNILVAERNRLLVNSSLNNPRVISANQKLSDGKKSIELTVVNLVQSYTVKERELEKLLKTSKRKMASIPVQQFDMAQIVRKQQIIEPLYLLLQQKREEAQISIYSKTDNVRVIESAYGSNIPIKPNKNLLLLVACAIGFLLPPIIMLLRMLFKIKVETSKDIEGRINAPILGIIPKDKQNRNVLSDDCRDSFAESLRTLCSNIQFLQGKVFQVTSSIHGEGKSFVSANLATSLAYTGKKVLLVGLDLRKPSIRSKFPTMTFEEDKSVVSYLSSQADDLSLLISRNAMTPNLDILISGKIPPNPTVLLSLERFKEMIAYFREKYDYVICDSTPYFAVSDSSIINRYMDNTLYIIRADYTDLRNLPDIDRVIKEGKLKNVNMIFNSVNLEAFKYRYGYGYGYGHSYGYGYRYEYGEAKKKKKRGVVSKLINKLKRK